MSVEVPVTLRQLHYFAVVVEEGSVSRAAARLHVAQPSVSQQIRVLEQIVGGPLLDRHPRGVRPTMMGRALLPRARESLSLASAAVRDAQAAGALGGGMLHLGALATIAAGVLPATIRVWRATHPEIDLQLFEFRVHEDELPAALDAGVIDVAIGRAPDDWPGPAQEIGTEQFVIVMPTGTDRPKTLAAIADRRWVLYEPGHSLGDITDRMFAHHEIAPPKPAVRTGAAASAVQLAAAGLGPALVPANMVPKDLAPTVFLPEPRITRTLSVFGRAGAAAPVDALAELAIRHAVLTPDHLGATD